MTSAQAEAAKPGRSWLRGFFLSIPVALLVGALSYPAVGHFELNGYLWLYLVCYSANVLGAHFNSHLVFREK